ncbi:MAG: hypothetical protein P4L82_04725 [Ancalomicrobiaceae bacterium]|nr:hypothetical protein [Ancalomicrobiaceae bacterium]
MEETPYPTDCSRCQALCCVYPAFDKSDMFDLDKAGGEPCPNLRADHRCAIHDGLATRGFAGCELYDCLGAGPRVVAMSDFAGRFWRDDEATATAMFTAFRRLRDVHALAELLATAKRLPLSPNQGRTVARLLEALDLDRNWSGPMLEHIERSGLGSEIRAFLVTLRGVAGQPGR